ncbi:hypothetical protein IFE17_02725 [Actinobacillus sp. GY-402]|nr:hypothetical protein IFE17_02725 [Actinobacillus sp. GY-402]
MTKHRKKSANEKLDLILAITENISDKVDQQNEEIADLRRQMMEFRDDLEQISQKSRNQAFLAGGIGGGIVAVGIEFIRLKFGG